MDFILLEAGIWEPATAGGIYTLIAYFIGKEVTAKLKSKNEKCADQVGKNHPLETRILMMEKACEYRNEDLKRATADLIAAQKELTGASRALYERIAELLVEMRTRKE